ncbi:long-chain-fatty-acid--CoA ligase [Parvibaculum sedimenti]|uniref:3-methylmercaptopropionyl-CoA ligase n=1 Tax=Parvibaculum sedimenti TaxID=2608632 RepID=A0A6N6VGM2_9HYPH|nr:long-chain-fatty-acid--CoA ligase [Parvibaculum sedimenti]KAB7738832.1 long-chain-fatty-acid--CoA ligase [Parvibaculum sedimenti]
MFDREHIHSVADITRAQAKAAANDVAQVFEGRVTTYAELDKRASRVAQGLIAEGCKPGARVGFIGKNSDRYYEMLYGAVKAKAVVVGVNWRLAPPEVAYVLNDARTEIVFVGAEFYDVIQQVLSECPSVKRVIALDGGRSDWISFDEWRDGYPAADPMLPAHIDDDVIQLYTSGTTGHPKGVQLTNRNYLATFEAGEASGWADWKRREVCLVCMPLFHVAGVNIGIIGHVHGTKNVILKDVDPQVILKLIESEKINIAFMVPAVILFLLQQPNIKTTDVSSLRQILYGASPIAEDVLRQAQSTFNAGFVQLYGLTETTGGATYLPPDAHDPAKGKLRSCGIPYSNMEIRVVDEKGEDVPQGGVGEIVIRGGMVMKGYWNRPEATEDAVRGGWFHSGDAGYFDTDGYLYIHDRVKDMIVSGGENVYPAEVENALFGHPAIADVAVIGVPDERWGEAVKACVVLKPGQSVEVADIIAFAKTRIAGFKVPKSIDIVQALPRNPSGKILRRELRAPYWEGRERMVN